MSTITTSNKYCISLETIQLIINFIEEHLQEPLTPNQIAKKFHMHVSTMNEAFKIVCQLTITEYIRNRRLTLAGKALLTSNAPIIELAYQFGYETPEAFTKAFSRFHGFPPTLVRRAYPQLVQYNPLQIKLEMTGGWENARQPGMTKRDYLKQDIASLSRYDESNQLMGGDVMSKEKDNIYLALKDMKQQDDWRVLLHLTKQLEKAKIIFKVDGKTMIFAHGLEFPLEKICLTFNLNEEEKIKQFFNYGGEVPFRSIGFKYFDSMFEGMPIRCMFFGGYVDAHRNEMFFNNTDVVHIDGQVFHVQTLQFYYENGNKDDRYYDMVKQWIMNK